MTSQQIMKKYPRLCAHMVAESLGYFTPTSAARAVLHYKQNEPYFCEWYSHMARNMGGMFDPESVKTVGRRTIKNAYSLRHSHKGYMSSYLQAKALIDQAIATGKEPTFASWF